MKKRSVLNKQSIKKRKQKKKTRYPAFVLIRQTGPVFFKCFIAFAIIAGISLSLMYCYHRLLTSPYMRLEKVEVKGVGQDIGNDLIDMCSLNSDLNLLALNMRDLKQKMEKHPWIRKIKLERKFPNSLLVHAEKQVPSALVVMDKIYYMNQQNEVFKQINDSDPIDFPVITGVSMKNRRFNWQLHRAGCAIRILESQKKPWSLKELSEIHVKDKGISLYFKHFSAGINVMSDDLECKIHGLRKVTKHLRKEGRVHQVTGIDLNSEDGAVVSFKKG